MPLSAVVAGNTVNVTQLNQLINLLTGVMTDQAVQIVNDFKANTVRATGANALGNVSVNGRFIGQWTTAGAPTGLTAQVNDFGWDGNQTLWVCTAAGTPGTWKQAGIPLNTNAANIAALAGTGAAGAVGTSADAGHVHPDTGLGVLASGRTWTAAQAFSAGLSAAIATLLGVTGTPNNWRLGGALTAQAAGTAGVAPASGTWSAGDLVADLKGFLWMCRVGGTPGTWHVLPRGFGVEPQTIFTANTRNDAEAVAGDLLING
jgi:hypothetical protein